MWEVDGSRGEGGGQVLRTTLALASVVGQPVRLRNIRARRPNPGLAPSHVTTVEALARLTGAKVEGAAVRSTSVEFHPGPVRAGKLELDIGTAGSITLVLQACLPVALGAPGPVTLDLRGGTDVPWSPPVDYLSNVFLPLLHRLGPRVDVEVLRRGYYPRGGGRVIVHVAPAQPWGGLDLDDRLGEARLGGTVHVANLPEHIPRRVRQAALQVLGLEGNPSIETLVLDSSTAEGQGGSATLWATFGSTILGSSMVAERGLQAEDLGRRVATELKTDLDAGATVDPRAADQMLPYLALARGPSVLRVRTVTRHLATQVDLLRELTGCRFTLAPEGLLHCVHIEPLPQAPSRPQG